MCKEVKFNKRISKRKLQRVIFIGFIEWDRKYLISLKAELPQLFHYFTRGECLKYKLNVLSSFTHCCYLFTSS